MEEELGVSSRPAREVLLDSLRGVAFLLMALDHVLLVGLNSGWPLWLFAIRATVTRLAMPMFMLVSGYLWYGHPPRRARVVCLLLLGAVLTVVWVYLRAGVPDILFTYGAVAAVAPVVRSWPVPFLALALFLRFRFPLGVSGYEPATIAAWLACGVMVGKARAGRRFMWEGPRWAAWAGRFPATMYAGHILLLFAFSVLGWCGFRRPVLALPRIVRVTRPAPAAAKARIPEVILHDGHVIYAEEGANVGCCGG